MATITGNSAWGSEKCDLFPTTKSTPAGIPSGFDVNCMGLAEIESKDGATAIEFSLTMPKGYDLALGDGLSGSGGTKMLATFKASDSENSNTAYWMVWFNSKDTNDDGWSMDYDLMVNNTTYTYTFKKGTGGEDN